MTTDLRTPLRTAETVEQRCAAITATIGHVLPDGPRDSPDYNARVTLYLLVERVRIGELPPTILLGVVTAMRPEGMTIDVRDWKGGATACANSDKMPVKFGDAFYAECALALAILDAMEGGNG